METTIGDDEAITLNSQRGLSAQNSMPRASRQAGTVEIQKQARHLQMSSIDHHIWYILGPPLYYT
jgi:hypothetical protein